MGDVSEKTERSGPVVGGLHPWGLPHFSFETQGYTNEEKVDIIPVSVGVIPLQSPLP
jgi:hypothetical protein